MAEYDENDLGKYVPLAERWAEPELVAQYIPKKDRSILVVYPAPSTRIDILKPGDLGYEEVLDQLKRAGAFLPWDQKA